LPLRQALFRRRMRSGQETGLPLNSGVRQHPASALYLLHNRNWSHWKI